MSRGQYFPGGRGVQASGAALPMPLCMRMSNWNKVHSKPHFPTCTMLVGLHLSDTPSSAHMPPSGNFAIFEPLLAPHTT